MAVLGIKWVKNKLPSWKSWWDGQVAKAKDWFKNPFSGLNIFGKKEETPKQEANLPYSPTYRPADNVNAPKSIDKDLMPKIMDDLNRNYAIGADVVKTTITKAIEEKPVSKGITTVIESPTVQGGIKVVSDTYKTVTDSVTNFVKSDPIGTGIKNLVSILTPKKK